MKTPVLLVHGNPGSARVWEVFQEQLLARGIKSYAFTLPGFAGEPWPEDGDFSLEKMAEFLWEKLERVVDGPVVIIGHSHGGSVATVMAGMRPEKVKGLCLLGTAGLDHGNYKWMRIPVLLDLVKMAGPVVDELELEVHLAKYLANNAKGKISRRINPALLTPLDGKTLEASFCAARDWKPEPVRWAITQINFPVTVIHGKKDSVVPPGELKELLATLPNPTVVWIEKGGHSPHLDQPDLVIKEVDKLCQSVSKKHGH